MAQYSITGPDGRLYSIDGPEGASREQVIRAIQARMAEPTTAQPVTPPPAPPVAPPPVEDQSFLRSVADVPLGLGSGLVSGVRNAADSFGAGSDVSQALKNTESYIDDLMSAQSKQDSQEMARIMQDAEGKGLGTQLRAGLKALSIAPIDVLSRSFGAMAPIVAATAGTVLSGGTLLAAGAVGAGLSAITGAGLIKGTIYDAVKTDPTLAAKLSPEKLEEVAQQAQAYNGENLDQILLGAGLYSLESLVGVPKQLANVTTRILTKAGASQAARATTESGIAALTERASKGILPTAAKAAAAGAGTEFLQEGQEQLAENLALQREGVDVATLKGVIPRATLGAGMGAIAGGVGGGADVKLARNQLSEALRRPDELTQEDFDELVNAAETLNDPELAAHFRERARQELADDTETETETDTETDTEEAGAADEVSLKDVTPGAFYPVEAAPMPAPAPAPAPAPVSPPPKPTPRDERPVEYDRPEYTVEDLEYLAGQAEASGNDEEAEMYRNEADQVRIRRDERVKAARAKQPAPPPAPAPAPAPAQAKQPAPPPAPAPAPAPAQAKQPAPTPIQTTPTIEETSGQAQTVKTETQKRQVGQETPASTDVAPTPDATVGEPAATAEKSELAPPVVEPVVEPVAVTKETLRAVGVPNPALKTATLLTAVNTNAPVEERVAALRRYAAAPRVDPEVKQRVAALADSLATSTPAAPTTKEVAVEPVVEPVVEASTSAAPATEEAALAEITADTLQAAGVNQSALRTKELLAAVNPKTPVADRVAALRKYAGNPNITSKVKANVTALATAFEANPAPKGLTAKGAPRQNAKGQGRPAAVLTAEEQANKTKAANEVKAARELVARRMESAEKTITTSVNDFINIVTDGLVAQAERTEKRTVSMAERRGIASGVATITVSEARVTRLADAYRVLKKDPKARSKSAQAAKALLEHPSVTAEERAKAQAEAKADPTVRSGARAGVPVDPVYAEFTTADQAITHILNTGTRFQRALANRLKPLLKGVKLVLVQSLDDVPAGEIRDKFTEGTNAAGLYADSNRTIYINGMEGESGTDASTVLHEGLHAATLRLIVAWMSDASKLSLKQRQLVKQLSDVMLAANERLMQRRMLGLLTQEELELYRVGAFTDLREFITYGITNEDMQEFLLKTDGTFVESSAPLDVLSSMLTRFVQTVRKLFNMDEEHSSAFQDLVILTEQMLSAANMKLPPVAVSAAAKINRETRNLNRQATSARATELPGVMSRMVKAFRGQKPAIDELRGAYSTMGSKAIQGVVPALTTDDLIRWVGDKIPALKRINKAVEEMNGWRNKELRRVAEKTEGWVKFAKSNPVAQRALGSLMQISTLVGVDPTLHADGATALVNDDRLKELQAQAKDPQLSAKQSAALKGQIGARQSDIKLVYKLWDKLGATDPTGKAKKLYADIKKEYERIYDMQMDELLDKVERSKEIQGSKNDPATPKGKLMADIVRSFQEAKKIGVYFPLVRYGQYWLRVGKKGAKNSEFYMFESEFSRDALADVIAKEKGTSRTKMLENLEMDLGNDPRQLRTMIESDSSSQMLKDIYKTLDARSAPEESTQQTLSPEEARAQADAEIQDIKDMVYRMYLHTLPERDMRKRFLKRQGRTGYNTDVIRNFITVQHSAVNQLTRLKFNERARLEVSAARESLTGNPDKKLNLFVDEMSKRVELELAPPNPNDLLARMASLGNKVVFYYMMTAPKSAAIQILQLPTVGLPVLAAKYGWAKTTALIPKYLNLYKSISTTRTNSDGEVVTEWGQPSLQNASYITESKDPKYREVMTKAWNILNDAGGFTVTFASEMSERGGKPTSEFDWKESPVSSGFRATANFMGGALHHMERLTREVMGMSAFELAYAKAQKDGMSPDAALNTAVDEALHLVTEGLFNYSAFNKPRIFRTPLAKLPTQFMTFPLQMTSYLIRNFFGMLPFVNKEGKTEAAEKFFTTLAMTFAFGGVTALPLYSAFMGMLDTYRELMREELEDDPEEYMQYDAAGPAKPWGKRSYDLYFRDTVIPSLFGNGSSVANYLGLTKAQAQTLARGIELGPVSAFTDMNIGASTALDNMWFRDDTPSETNRAAFEALALKLLGPFGSFGTQIAGAIDDFEKGDLDRGLEKLTPAFFRGALAALRLSEEGSQTAAQNAKLLGPEFYTTGKLLVRGFGFASTTEAEIQKSNILAKRVVEAMEQERVKLVDSAGKALLRLAEDATNASAKKEFDAQIQKMAKFNLRNPFAAITGETLNESLRRKVDNRDRASMLQGIMVSETMTGVVMPMVESSRTTGKE